jgi:uncharacterized protein (TIGR03084 family)
LGTVAAVSLTEEIAAALAADTAELYALVGSLDLDLPTPADGWTVRDTVAHLHASDLAALAALDGADLTAHLGQVVDARYVGEDLLADWNRDQRAVRAAVLARPATAGKIGWFGPPMSPASFLTARLMETWAHGVDIKDAAGVPLTAGAGLRHVCDLGVRTRGWSYLVHGLDAPDPPPAVRLQHRGEQWNWGTEAAGQHVSGPALHFALLVTQRRHRDDLELVAQGADADRWLDLAQAFAGPPGRGRSPGARVNR